MKKSSYSIKEFTQEMQMDDIQELMRQSKLQFTKRFGLEFSKDISVTLVFETSYDANDFYNEIRFNKAYSMLYRVAFNTSKANSLIVSGQATLFDYFGTNEPNLLTASRDLGLQFTIDFVQDYTGSTFKGSVMNGELLARQCIVEVSSVLPELTLGGLCQIAGSFEEFDLLLTRIYTVRSEALL
ncbi:hypothetical protein AOC36_09855 [Erysipelothrix larvae]|uniref:Uncharacterized protein n=1 Tax=Erysipelothrix larvae TaxID=1514105 RepID=A0A0X8H1C9_9FIRM|nr:hypothetical protein [Erysipelothrix larvae]AMC94271.1 hypothetical protein AOC36_09855 [Erysipelothrix larvae]